MSEAFESLKYPNWAMGQVMKEEIGSMKKKLKALGYQVTYGTGGVDLVDHLQLKAENENLKDLLRFMDESGIDTHKFYSMWQEKTGGR